MSSPTLHPHGPAAASGNGNRRSGLTRRENRVDSTRGAELASLSPPAHAGRVYAAERWLARRILSTVGNPPIRIVLWNGEEIAGCDAPPVARVIFRDRRALLRLLANGELHFGDAYTSGRIEVDGDLSALLETLHRAMAARISPPGPLRRTISCWLRQARANSFAGARANIHHHYDLGEDFYRLWLDREMVYSCAYFPTLQATLDEAQQAKLDYVCRKLWLRPGETVVDVGGGWGALALYMARHFGVNVKAVNISHAQTVYARNCAQAEGLAGQVEFIEDDYRNIRGRFDVLVSLGMLEHVGNEHYREFGRMVSRCLGPSGRGMLHTIGRTYAGGESPWIERRIFPGGYLPSLREVLNIVEPGQFAVLDVENLRLHYANTLRHWLERFEAAGARVAQMFDERFVRTWRLYLTGSMCAFRSGALQLFQVVFARPTLNELPWTRARLYDSKAARS